ncbi:hypothetical protein GGF42_002264 [Coemansia sp. RSA 2424]|nr:hypothetical protein GGF42_002264 [Coemansia sp. RSA 2424]
MASLDDLEFSEEDDHTGELEAPTIALQTASSPLAPPSQPPSSAPALAAPEAKAGVAQSKILAKSHVVPPPRDTKTSSPRLGTVADIAVIASPVPKILSFQEIMERKRRRQAEAIASDDAPRPLPPPVTEARSPAVEAKSPEAGARVLAGKRRIVVDEDDVDSDASEGKRAKPEPPVQQPHVSEAIPDYVAMFERELEDLTADLDGPLENTPAGDMISRATIANNAFIDQDFESLLGL